MILFAAIGLVVAFTTKDGYDYFIVSNGEVIKAHKGWYYNSIYEWMYYNIINKGECKCCNMGGIRIFESDAHIEACKDNYVRAIYDGIITRQISNSPCDIDGVTPIKVVLAKDLAAIKGEVEFEYPSINNGTKSIVNICYTRKVRTGCMPEVHNIWVSLDSGNVVNWQFAQQVDSAEASTIAVPPSEPSGSPR